MIETIWSWLSPLHEDFESLWVIALFASVLLIFERLYPADTSSSSKKTGSDVIYTLFENLGISGLVLTLTLSGLLSQATETFEAVHLPRLHLDALLEGWGAPAVISFLVQVFVFDGFDTLRHRVEHRLNWLWAFHSVHHSQTHMTFMTFDRNHVVSLLLNSTYYAALSWFLGLSPGRFFILYLIMHFMEYLSHANVRLSFGRYWDRILVCPLYHRTHHAIATQPRSRFQYGCNFANLFPFWDILFGSACFEYSETRTGIAGQSADEAGRSWLSHQISGFRLFKAAVSQSRYLRLMSGNPDRQSSLERL